MQVQSVRDPLYVAALEARFALAAAHSRRVRLLRKALPALIGTALLALLALSIFNPFRMLTKLPIDIGSVVVSGTTITMQSPHMAGFTADRRPYEVWARSAKQDVTDPTNIELHVLKAKVEMEDKSIVDVDARRGQFNNKTQLLHLQDDIFLKTSTGYEARLTDAMVDMDKSTVHSDRPVAVKLLNGNLDARNLDIVDHGALMIFYGGVGMDLVLNNDSTSQPLGQSPSQQPSQQPGQPAPKSQAGKSQTTKTQARR
jgi:lipopolysaccharide export system protein LptC